MANLKADIELLESYFGGRKALETVLGVSDRRIREWIQAAEGRKRNGAAVSPLSGAPDRLVRVLADMIRSNCPCPIMDELRTVSTAEARAAEKE